MLFGCVGEKNKNKAREWPPQKLKDEATPIQTNPNICRADGDRIREADKEKHGRGKIATGGQMTPCSSKGKMGRRNNLGTTRTSYSHREANKTSSKTRQNTQIQHRSVVSFALKIGGCPLRPKVSEVAVIFT